MQPENDTLIVLETVELDSVHLERSVTVDLYLPVNVANPAEMSLLLINDGQDMIKAGLASSLEGLYETRQIRPVFCAAIHAGADRKMEYGTINVPDFKGRGAKAGAYSLFLFEELLPYLRTTYQVYSFREKVFAGFSLGGLSALDIVLEHPGEFSAVGVFSASLWWRSRDQDDEDYSDDTDRIIHQKVRNSQYHSWLRFFLQCGALDEDKDRNKNGVIDSIDDTLDLIAELKNVGYPDEQIHYLLLEDGKHDVETWGRAMPEFLKWVFGKQ